VRHAVFAYSLLSALALSEQVAHANGRFPRAQRLLEDPNSPERLVLAATYGLLVTDDRGAEWRHVCELGYAFSIDDLDPLVELPPDGSLLVTASHSLNRSASPFCSFEPVLGSPDAGTETVVDYSLDRSDRNRVVALLMRSGEAGIENVLHESTDAGGTFSPIGVPLPPAEVSFTLTLDVAPSDSDRFYVSAAGRLGSDVLVRSDDAGSTWTTFALPLEADEYPYIAAVHPTDPDVLYVRTDFWPLDADNVAVASDGLLYSDDGGTTFREIHRAAGKLFGFALSPDASELVIGYGDPVESTRLVDPEALGIYRASTSDHVFTKIFEGPVSCLSWTENGVYVCTSQRERGFALGVAPNADFDLAATEPLLSLLDLRDVRGPLDCPACASGAVCRERWPENCGVFGNCDAGAAAVGGGAGTDCSSGGSAGAGGSGNGGARSGASGSGPEQGNGESSCGCRSAGAPAGAGTLGGLVLAAHALTRRRFRRARGAGEATRTKREP
jgi:hypothetical protein